MGPRSLVRIASENVPASAPERGARRRGSPASAGSRGSCGADHPGGGHGHLLRLHAQRLGGGGLLASGGLEPAPAVAHVRVRGVGGHRPQRVGARLARHHHRRAHARVGGEAGGRHRVLRVAHEHAHVEALGLEPGRHAGGPEARAPGRWARARSRAPGRSTQRERKKPLTASPSVLGQPEHQVQVLERLSGGALPEVVDGARRRSSGRPPRSRAPGSGWCPARAACAAARPPRPRTARRRRPRGTASTRLVLASRPGTVR